MVDALRRRLKVALIGRVDIDKLLRIPIE